MIGANVAHSPTVVAMTDRLEGETWSERLTLGVANRVRSRRLELNLTLDELAGRLAALSFPYSRQAISKLESGRLRSPDVALIYALAGALECSPVVLLVDASVQEDSVEVLPEIFVPGWEAIGFATGQTAATRLVADAAGRRMGVDPQGLGRDMERLDARSELVALLGDFSAGHSELTIAVNGRADPDGSGGMFELDPAHPETVRHLREAQAARRAAIERLVYRLRQLGVDIDNDGSSDSSMPGGDLSHSYIRFLLSRAQTDLPPEQ